MTHTSYVRQVSFLEIAGLVIGGGALAALIAAQVMFLAWML